MIRSQIEFKKFYKLLCLLIYATLKTEVFEVSMTLDFGQRYVLFKMYKT